jgi:hypothetical protein
MNTIPRSAGIGLLVYTVGTTAAFIGAGGPGGDYKSATISGYIDPSHYPTSLSFWYLGALSALGLLAFGYGLRRLDEPTGETAWAMSIAAMTTSVVGAFVGGGLVVALAEGGPAVRQGMPLAVVYTLSEIGNLLSLCGPAFFVGVLAIVLAARAQLPRWLGVLSALGGLCGILLPFYFTIPLYLLWTVTFGVWLIARASRPLAHAKASLEESLV